MRMLAAVLPILLAGLVGCGEASPDPGPATPVLPPSSIPATATHLLVVRSASWEATKGHLMRYERAASGWTPVGSPINVVLGKNGVGWGRGLHGDGAPGELSGPVKAEGDGKAPAGVFAIGGAYGYDMAPPQGTQVPYVQVTDTWRCVDDVMSTRYNEVFDSADVATPDWTSSEMMLRPDELYTRVVVVDHNPPPARPGGGSCIFLHVWRDPDSTTSGCTAMPLADLETVMTFLTPDTTVLVQMEDATYTELADAWELPK